MIYQFKVQLIGFRPPIWRRLQVDADMTFSDFHRVLQTAFDWEDYHLHTYRMTRSGGKKIEPFEIGTVDEYDLFSPLYKEEEAVLSDFFLKEKDRAVYTYDFGDDWNHEIVLEKVLAPENGVSYPLCVKAMREAPEEDSRGMYLDGVSPEETMNTADLTRYINEELEHFLEPEFPEQKEPDFDWPRLLKAAKELNQLAPWNILESDDIYIIVDPITEERLFCSVLGKASEVYGLAVYIGKEGFESLLQIMNRKTESEFELSQKQRAVLLSFVNRDELEKEDYELIKAAGIPFRGKNQWPEFRSYLPGYYPWMIDREEARLLLLAIEQFPYLFQDIKEKKLIPSGLLEEEWIARTPQLSTNGDIIWKTDYVTSAILNWDLTNKEEYPLYISELDVKRISKYKKDKSVVEFDCFPVNMPVQEKAGDRPYFPNLTVAIDQESGMVLFQEMQSGQNSAEQCQLAFVKFLQNRHTIPTEIWVSETVYEMLFPIKIPFASSLIEAEVLPGMLEFKHLLEQMQM
ncbi:plasmid pRiA4b ORF-3 family protein [Lederbergia sp. NSJ-179]|uniref:plasmid pRiA4b ORF-3 family protein n=1 Tax=Lederbergia sp. NSJ-179 TaxID=2931402 RepID=UPI001FD326D0|nr:plasmid pRiA4b ORF-3 family protein [Lederbergia sp. NSJ-179]MCJ7840157.1 plasmid pRiA4b ORF-3 family protein [Lederbergia sp. NSJ-179]